MRHAKRRRKLNRSTAKRKALLRSLVIAILKKERIITTLPKAKEAGRLAEKIITLGKRADLASQRRAFSLLLDRSLVKELVSEIAPRFKNRQGGYTRIMKLSKYRKGDNAEMALLELTERKVIVPSKKAKKEKKEEIKKEQPPAPETAEEKKPHKEEAPKHPTKEEKHPHVEKPRKGFFHGLQKFLRPPKTTS